MEPDRVCLPDRVWNLIVYGTLIVYVDVMQILLELLTGKCALSNIMNSDGEETDLVIGTTICITIM